ncbi:unnamed protein product [Closterium sp. NIES-64]|nr:unnamed protein product [Closterium sp. NIES-64]
MARDSGTGSYHSELAAVSLQGKTVVVGGKWRASPWRLNVLYWKQPTVRPGDFLVFRWRFVPHDVWVMHSRKAFANCDFSAGSATRKTGISFTGKYMYKVPSTAAGSTLYFGSSVLWQCSAWKIKVAIKIRTAGPPAPPPPPPSPPPFPPPRSPPPGPPPS